MNKLRALLFNLWLKMFTNLYPKVWGEKEVKAAMKVHEKLMKLHGFRQ